MGDVKGMVTVHDFDSNSEIMHIETNQGVVRCLKWHPQTRDVMIAGSEKGCALLNTRKSKKPLMNIVDPSGRQNVSGLCWHESMRSVVITYDSFGRPNSTNHHLSHHGSSSGGSVVQLWDLRHTNAPYAEFGSFHQRGIIGIETSRIDPRFFMTCSREGRGILWAMSGPSIVPYAELDVKTPIDDFYLSQGSGLPLVCLKHANTNTEETSVNTSPAQSTKSPFLSFHDIDAHTLPDSHVVHDASNSIKFTPKWMNSGASLDFGFGGKLAWFTPSNDQDVAGISNVCSDELFIESINQFTPYLERNDLAGYCGYRAQLEGNRGSPGADMKSNFQHRVWLTFQAVCSPMDQRAGMFLDILGFNPQSVMNEVNAYLGHAGGSIFQEAPRQLSITSPTSGIRRPGTDHSLTDGGGGSFIPGPSPDSTFDTDNFFNRLANENATAIDSKAVDDDQSVASGVGGGRENYRDRTMVDKHVVSGPGYFVSTNPEQWQKSPLKLMKESFLTGSPLSALEVAVKNNQFALAFMLAAELGDPNVRAILRTMFLEVNKDPFVTTLALSSNRNFTELVALCDLNEWQEVLAVLITYLFTTDPIAFKTLARELAKRLQLDQGDNQAAKIVYLMAEAYQETAELISTMPAAVQSNGLQGLKIFILASISPGLKLERAAHKSSHRFICRLVNAGRLNLATSLMNMIDNSLQQQHSHSSPGNSPSAAATATQLKYLISECTATIYTPTRPTFEYFDVQTSPDLQESITKTTTTATPSGNFYQTAPRAGLPPQQYMNSGGGPPPSQRGSIGVNSHVQPDLRLGGYNSMLTQHPPPPPPVPPPPMPAYGGIGQPSMAPYPLTYQPSATGGPPHPPSYSVQQSVPPPQQPQHVPYPPSPGVQQLAFAASPAVYQQGNELAGPPPPLPHQGYPSQRIPSNPIAPGVGSIPGSTASGNSRSRIGGRDYDIPPCPPSAWGTNAMPGTTGLPTPSSDAVYHQLSKTTHPAAAINPPLPPGMPTPWPIPTSTQQLGARISSANEKYNQQVHQATHSPGVACPGNELARIKQGLEGFIGNLVRMGVEDPKKTAEYSISVNELVQQLEKGQITQEVQQRLKEYVDQLNRSEGHLALASCQNMISVGWNKDSKGWLSMLKKLASTCRGSAPSSLGGMGQGGGQMTPSPAAMGGRGPPPPPMAGGSAPQMMSMAGRPASQLPPAAYGY